MARYAPAILVLALVAGQPGAGAAQAANTVRPPVPPAPTVTAAPALPKPPDNYTYEPSGRRDPFLNLLARGTTDGKTIVHGDGLAGLSVADLSVRGVMQSRGGYVAIVQGPDNKTFIARANDRLQDGVIRAINAQGLVILQEVTDPLSLVKQKEVRKGLRASDEGK